MKPRTPTKPPQPTKPRKPGKQGRPPTNAAYFNPMLNPMLNPMPTETDTDRPLIAVAVLASFVAFLDGSVVNLALPAIGREFGGGLALQQWVVDGYLLSLGALILVAGAVSDQFGRLSVLRMGVVVFAVASVLSALAPSGWVLVAARCLQGIGAAFLVPSSLAMINARFSGAAQPRAIGTWTAWTGTAFVIGPLLGGVLVDAVGWRWIFAVNIVPLALTLYLTTKLGADEFAPPADRQDAKGRSARIDLARIDLVGAALNAGGLTGAVYALIEGQRLGFSYPPVVAGLAIGLTCLAVFPWWESRSGHPMMPLHIFAARNFAVGNLARHADHHVVPAGDRRPVGHAGGAGHAAVAGAVVLVGPPVRHTGRCARATPVHGRRSADRRGRLPVDDDGARGGQL